VNFGANLRASPRTTSCRTETKSRSGSGFRGSRRARSSVQSP
jgi:hypothetical protein